MYNNIQQHHVFCIVTCVFICLDNVVCHIKCSVLCMLLFVFITYFKPAARAYIVSAGHVSTHNNIRIGGRVVRDV